MVKKRIICRNCRQKISMWSNENGITYVCGRCGTLTKSKTQLHSGYVVTKKEYIDLICKYLNCEIGSTKYNDIKQFINKEAKEGKLR